MAKFFKIICLLIYLPIVLIAQYENIKFEHLTVEQGLSQSIVQYILQDSRGFMWFVIEESLNNYDGYKFKIYKYDPDYSLSLNSNWITAIYENQLGKLWIENQKGYVRTLSFPLLSLKR